jgi:hypothetical protein
MIAVARVLDRALRYAPGIRHVLIGPAILKITNRLRDGLPELLAVRRGVLPSPLPHNIGYVSGMNSDTLSNAPRAVRLAVARGLLAMLADEAVHVTAQTDGHEQQGGHDERNRKHQNRAHAASHKVSL